jgi:predicted MFS family arabinose efflux permease
VDSDHVGIASGINSAVARVAGLVGTALLGFVFARQGDEFIGGFRTAVLSAMVCAVLALLCALRLTPAQTDGPHPREH